MKQIKNIFPVKVQVTQEMIDNAKLGDIYGCIGALALRSLNIPEVIEIKWGAWTGFIITEKSEIHITTDKEINVMEIKKPTEVTFKLV